MAHFHFFTVTEEAKPAPDYQNLPLNTIMAHDQDASNSYAFLPVYQELNQDTKDGSEYSTLDETTVRNNSGGNGNYTSLDRKLVSNGDESAVSRLDTNAY